MKVGGSSKKGRQSSHRKGEYQRQAVRTMKNKEKARKKHLEKHPNDAKARQDIKKAKGF